MSTVKEALVNMRELLSDPEHWCQGELAIDNAGMPVDTEAPEAYAWCLVGAIDKVTENARWRTQGRGNKLVNNVCNTMQQILSKVYRESVSEFNDEATHLQVLEFLDKCIEIA